MDAEARKQALKGLRKERAQWIAQAAADMKRQKRELKGIRGCLAAGPATVPQIAEQTGLPAALVLWYVAALKKYGELVEGRQEGRPLRVLPMRRLGRARRMSGRLKGSL